jgi:uncharacterized membrane protein required for colicin V production
MTDLILALLALLFALRGFARGAARPLIESAGFAVAVVAGATSRSALGGETSSTALLAGVIIAAGIMLAAIAGSGALVDESTPTPVDRLGGLATGLFQGAVLAAGIALLAGEPSLPVPNGLAPDPLDGIVESSGVLRFFRDELLPATGLLRGW